MRPVPGLLAASLLLTALGLLPPARAEDGQALSIAQAQPLFRGEAKATGRVVTLKSARIGSRLSAHIAVWGANAAGQPWDVGLAVAAGQELFRLEAATFEQKVRTAEAALKMAEALAADLRAGTRKERQAGLRAALEELEGRQAELEARLADRKKDTERIRRLVEEDKTMPLKRLEEMQLECRVFEAQLRTLAAQRLGAKARLEEAETGPTPTELGVAEARVVEARSQLASARLDLDDTAVKAPFAGVITQRFKSAGDYVANAPFVEVLELASLDDLEAEMKLPEAFYHQIEAGKTEVALRTPLLPAELPLPVTRVVPAIDTQQGTFAFRVRIPPELRGRLVPGAFLEGTLKLPGTRGGAVIPLQAVLTRDGQSFVFVVEDGKARRRAIEPGDRLTEALVVRSGLQGHEKVLVGPLDKVEDGAVLPSYLLNGK